MREFGLLPVQVQWAKLCARVWNKTSRDIKTLQEESLDSITMRADLRAVQKRQHKMLDFIVTRGHGAFREGGGVYFERTMSMGNI